MHFDKGARLKLGIPHLYNRNFESSFSFLANSTIKIKGNFAFRSGAQVSVNKDAILELGHNSFINSNCYLHCFEKISIGSDTVISENVTIRDSDNHKISTNNSSISAPIHIGDHVWIGMNATILKGVTIGKGAVVAANAVVTKDVPENCLVAGIPAKVIKTGISWE